MPLSRIARFQVTSQTALIISRGSVLDFSSKDDAAIVNAANEGCLGGGGVDGAISDAGGEKLFKARFDLPVIRGMSIRCPTGDAKITGPDQYGEIGTNHVIHAVGPNYFDFFRHEYDEADELLRDAYTATMDRAEEAKLKQVAFSLLSAGVFKGRRTLAEVLQHGVGAIFEWMRGHPKTSVETVYMCAFTKAEARTLLQVTKEVLLQEKMETGPNEDDSEDVPDEQDNVPKSKKLPSKKVEEEEDDDMPAASQMTQEMKDAVEADKGEGDGNDQDEEMAPATQTVTMEDAEEKKDNKEERKGDQ